VVYAVKRGEKIAKEAGMRSELTMEIKRVFVVGAGLMGSGIAQECAQAGLQTILTDVSQKIINKGLEDIAWSVGKFVEKGKLAEKEEVILSRIEGTTDFSCGADADLVIEVVTENLELKREIFRKLDETCRPDVVLASSTSAIPITSIGSATQHPNRVLGLHFFSPVPMSHVVEVVWGISSDTETIETGTTFVKRLGKTPIHVKSDVPGFLLNRINLISYVEAIRLLEQGIGTVEDIDRGVKLAFGGKMGPFETGDMVGLDVSCGALSAIYEDSKDMRYYPPQLLRRKVEAGQLGRKTGEGWYRYGGNGARQKG